MSEEKQNNPLLNLKDVPLMCSIELTLDCAKAIKEGESQFTDYKGNIRKWFLWMGIVEKTRVWEGKRPNLKPVDDYSGKVIFFPTEILNKKLVDIADGNVGVKVKITKTAKESDRGTLIKEYKVEKLSEGTPAVGGNGGQDLLPSEANLINDAEGLIKEGYSITEEDFIKASKEGNYNGKITEERAKQLYKMLKS